MPDEIALRSFVNLINSTLKNCGAELREVDIDGGYPVFSVVSTQSATIGRIKNLIFASSVKPDLRFRDAISNDVEIVTHADKVLIYDRPIGSDGLRWCDLQNWWQETQHIAEPEKAKKTLYRRLLQCLPQDSPPQLELFRSYFAAFTTSIPRLSALLPKVWLHWDPKTVKERGRDALFRFRMDFLLLLPHGVRVVLEVDGKQHYANGDIADPARFGAMVGADRELKLTGYHVFRFGAAELQGNNANAMLKTFFEGLFRRFDIAITTPNPAQAI